MARTQQQRREETVGRLLDACIATIIEVGYARASAAVITKRAGVSVGALFRHFDTMGDFMAATASEVLRRQLESFTKGSPRYPPTGRPWRRPWGSCVTSPAVRPTPSSMNCWWPPAPTKSSGDFATRARAVCGEDPRRRPGAPGRRTLPEDTFPVFVALMTNVFDGAAVVEGVLPQPDIAARRIPVLMALLTAALPD